MPRLNPGLLDQWVTLDDPIVDDSPVTFVPSRVKARVRSSGVSTEFGLYWLVDLRYHPQVTFHTRVTLGDGRRLAVQEIDNFGNTDRSGWMTVRCHEVTTP